MERKVIDVRNMDNDYIALEDLDFSWKKREVKRVIGLINNGATIKELKKDLKREGDEIFLLLMDLVRNNRIDPEHNILKEE